MIESTAQAVEARDREDIGGRGRPLAGPTGTIAAATLPRWTGICLIVGVVLVAATAEVSNAVRTVAAGLPDAAFIGTGVALLRVRWPVTSGERGP